MMITQITPVPLTAPYVRPNTPADYPSNGVRNCVWLRIDTADGLTGWGEAYCGCYATEVTVAALRRLTDGLIGQDLQQPGPLLEQMRFSNRYWAMNGIGAQCTSAVEAALWDIVARRVGQPLWQLLGDGERRPILLYASAGESLMPPDQIYEEARAFAAQGYRAYKMRCGGRLTASRGIGFDIERVAAARRGLGDAAFLFVDVAVPQKYPAWEQGYAEEYIQALRPYNIGFIEEPAMTYDVARYRDLQALKLMPVAGGESFSNPDEFEPFFLNGAYGIGQPDAAVVGGPASCVQVCRRAAEFGVPIALHAWSAGVGVAQNLHAGWSVPGILAMEWPQATHPLCSEPLKNIVKFSDGYALPAEEPGLGCEISEDLLQKYAYQPGNERDY